MTFNRREFLKRGASVAALTAAWSLLPPNLRRAVAQTPAPDAARPHSLRNIKHVVLLLQENRSFDHYFGTLSGVRGFADPDALRLPNGRPVFYQPDPGNPHGYLLPFHLDTHATSAQKIPSNSHSWKVQHAAWDNGRMDAWVTAHRKVSRAKAPYCMGYYERADIPFHFALAETFTVCDAYHCSLLGPTFPNRLYWMTGTINPQGDAGGPAINNRVPHGGYAWTTYPERLQQAGVSWKVYRESRTPGLNVLTRFRQYREAPRHSALHTRGGMRADLPGQFADDAIHDRLPAVSWLIPPFDESEHPYHWPAKGAAFIARQLDAIAANPDVWAKTVFILGYDENDGLFDHVAPPVAPPGTPDEFVHGQPIGAGFRVPCIVISPWSVGGWVCSEPYDHTSVLRLLERFTGVSEPNISAWRRQTFGDLTLPLQFDDADYAVPALPAAGKLLDRVRYEVASLPAPRIPRADQPYPVQEPGTRRHVRRTD